MFLGDFLDTRIAIENDSALIVKKSVPAIPDFKFSGPLTNKDTPAVLNDY